jgi:hypothetical protein
MVARITQLNQINPIRILLFCLQTSNLPKGDRTPTASRQASRHETKETKADVSIMTQAGVRRFS